MEADPDFSRDRNFYDVLGLPKSATTSEIKRAYYKLALKYHPDRVQEENKEKAKANFQALGRIYETLSDPDKRKVYDETGRVFDEEGEEGEKDWTQYWHALFKKVTTDDILHYEKAYKGSAIEEDDLKKAYTECAGDMERILEEVILSTPEDEPRFRKILDKAIKEEELPEFDKYRKKRKRKPNTKLQREAREAAQLAEELGVKSGEDGLKQLILGRKTKQQDQLDSLVAGLEAKYGGGEANGNKSAKGRGKSARKKRKIASEPTDEEFQAARERLTANKKDKQKEKKRKK